MVGNCSVVWKNCLKSYLPQVDGDDWETWDSIHATNYTTAFAPCTSAMNITSPPRKYSIQWDTLLTTIACSSLPWQYRSGHLKECCIFQALWRIASQRLPVAIHATEPSHSSVKVKVITWIFFQLPFHHQSLIRSWSIAFIPIDHVIIDTLHLFLHISDLLINLIHEFRRQDGIERLQWLPWFGISSLFRQVMRRFWTNSVKFLFISKCHMTPRNFCGGTSQDLNRSSVRTHTPV